MSGEGKLRDDPWFRFLQATSLGGVPVAIVKTPLGAETVFNLDNLLLQREALRRDGFRCPGTDAAIAALEGKSADLPDADPAEPTEGATISFPATLYADPPPPARDGEDRSQPAEGPTSPTALIHLDRDPSGIMPSVAAGFVAELSFTYHGHPISLERDGAGWWYAVGPTAKDAGGDTPARPDARGGAYPFDEALDLAVDSVRAWESREVERWVEPPEEDAPQADEEGSVSFTYRSGVEGPPGVVDGLSFAYCGYLVSVKRHSTCGWDVSVQQGLGARALPVGMGGLTSGFGEALEYAFRKVRAHSLAEARRRFEEAQADLTKVRALYGAEEEV